MKSQALAEVIPVLFRLLKKGILITRQVLPQHKGKIGKSSPIHLRAIFQKWAIIHQEALHFKTWEIIPVLKWWIKWWVQTQHRAKNTHHRKHVFNMKSTTIDAKALYKRVRVQIHLVLLTMACLLSIMLEIIKPRCSLKLKMGPAKDMANMYQLISAKLQVRKVWRVMNPRPRQFNLLILCMMKFHR